MKQQSWNIKVAAESLFVWALDQLTNKAIKTTGNSDWILSILWAGKISVTTQGSFIDFLKGKKCKFQHQRNVCQHVH